MQRIFDEESEVPVIKGETEIQLGFCPHCAEPNKTFRVHCRRCNYRLLWADQLEGKPPTEAASLSLPEKKLDVFLRRTNLLPEKPSCRYCDNPIEVYAHQCPHCRRWLNYRNEPALDAWQPNYRNRERDSYNHFDPQVSILVLIFTVLVAVIGVVVWLFVR